MFYNVWFTLDRILRVCVSTLMCLVVITLSVALCVMDLGSYFKRRCLNPTLGFKAGNTVTFLCVCFVVCFFNACCLCVHLSLNYHVKSNY